MLSQINRQLASTAFILAFFLLWEACCYVFKISDFVLPAPSQIAITLWERFPALIPHTLQTLYTTLAGFALGIVLGVALGMLIGSSRLAYDVANPLLIGFAYNSESRCRSNFRIVVRRRRRSGNSHRDDDGNLSHRGECRRWTCHHRARTRRRDALPEGHEV